MPDHGQRDAVVLDEAELVLEDLLVVAVEADDEPGVDVESRVLDSRQLGGQRIAPHVLVLLRFLQRCLPRRLDPDEHAAEIGPVHQVQQFGIVGQIDAGLGRQAERIVVLLHPGNELFQQRLGLLLVADEVVVHDERRVKTGPTHVVQFGHQLLGLLHARTPAVDHDDVAELALERAAARVLQRPRRVPIDLQQVVARARHLRHVGRLRLLVALLRRLVAGEVVEERGPGRLGLADEHDVAQSVEELLLHGNERAADDREDLHLPQPDQDLADPRLLHVHPRDADDVVRRGATPSRSPPRSRPARTRRGRRRAPPRSGSEPEIMVLRLSPG